jgi:hypothetical protein
MRTALLLADRTAVLFLGIAAGVAIGWAFGTGGNLGGRGIAVAGAPPAAERPGTGGQPAAAVPPRLEYERPFQPHLLQAVAANAPVTIGVFGDSFGDGVWTALYRLLPAKERYRVLKFSQQSTGFTRYARRNVQEHAALQIADQGPVDIAVVSFGANDTQGIYADGHAAALMSPEWQRIVGQRVDGFVALMRARGAVVYWLGLPKMRVAAFDSDIAAMNEFYRRRMAALRVPFIDVHPLTVDAAGNYADYLPDPVNGSEPRLLRANDGVHMSMNGYIVITRALASRIRDYVAAATKAALPGGAPPAPGAGTTPAPVPVPALVPPAPGVALREGEAKPAPMALPAPAVAAGPVRARGYTGKMRRPAGRPRRLLATRSRPAGERRKAAAPPAARSAPAALQLRLPPPETEASAPPRGDPK